MAEAIANTNIKHTEGAELPDASDMKRTFRSWLVGARSGLGNWRSWSRSTGFLIPASLSLIGLGYYFYRRRGRGVLNVVDEAVDQARSEAA